MRLICFWYQRQIARRMIRGEPVERDSPLAKHVALCAECSRARRDLGILEDAIPGVAPMPTLSDGFDERLRARLAEAQRQSAGQPARAHFSTHLQRTAIAMAAFSAVGLWFLGRSIQTDPTPSSDPTTATKAPPQQTTRARAAVQPGFGKLSPGSGSRQALALAAGFAGSMKDALSEQSTAGNSARRDQIRHRHRRRLPHVRGPFLAGAGRRPIKRTGASTVPAGSNLPETSLNISATWRDAGDTYEAYGDYSRASQAYGAAFEQEPDAELAIAASVNADRAGDTSQALTFIAEALRPDADGEADRAHELQKDDTP